MSDVIEAPAPARALPIFDDNVIIPTSHYKAMGPAPGLRYGGRQKGTPNTPVESAKSAAAAHHLCVVDAMKNATAKLSEEDIEKLGPKEVIEIAMRVAVRAASWWKAAELAEKVISYVHPKLQAVSVTNVNDDSEKTNAALERELAEIDARSQAGNTARTEETRMPFELCQLGD